MDETKAMCIRFAQLHISHWRQNKAAGLSKAAAASRSTALWWIKASKGGAA